MKLFGNFLRRWRMRRILKRHSIPDDVWFGVTRHIAVLQKLDAIQMAHLRVLSTWFLYSKSINGAQGFEVTYPMRVAVAAQACLLILNLDVDYFDNWVEVILYPGAFRVHRERRDAIGLVHDETRDLSGESWLQGAVVLSWDDVKRDSVYTQPGRNVVLHEFAHKLDGRNGATNGLPPLRPGMDRKSWAEDFNAAFGVLNRQIAMGEPVQINPYAATNPAEFFAVASEYFFTEPEILRSCFPAVHRQLTLLYR